MPLSDYALELLNKAKADADEASIVDRKELNDRAIEYYEGRTEAETMSFFDPRVKKKIAFGNNNVTKRITDRISQVHKVKPRIIFPEDTKQDLIDLYNQATMLDTVKFQRAERMTNLLKLVFLKSTYRNDMLELDIHRDFVPLMSEEDPMKPIGVAYPVHTTSDGTDEAEKWAIWTAEEQFTYYKGGEIIKDEDLDGVNPYGIFPGAFVFAAGAPPETEFTDVEPAMDLIETNLAINLALSEMNMNIRFQNFDYPYLTNVKNAGDVVISQDSFTELPPGVEMGVVGMQSHVDSTVTGIKFHYQAIAQNYGLDSKFVEGVGVESGIAMKVRQQELLDNRAGDLDNWRNVHAALYEIRKKQIEYHWKGKKMPDTMQVDFRESMKIQTDQEKREDADWMVQTGQKTYAQIMLEDNPDAFPGDEEEGVTPLEQAEQFIKDNLAKNRELVSAGEPPSALDIALQSEPEGELE